MKRTATACSVIALLGSASMYAQQANQGPRHEDLDTVEAISRKALNQDLNRLLSSDFAKQQLKLVQAQLRQLESAPEAQQQKAALDASLLNLRSDPQAQEQIGKTAAQLRELESSPKRDEQAARLRESLAKTKEEVQ